MLSVGHLKYIKDYIHIVVIIVINVAYEREQVERKHHVIDATIIMLGQEVIVTDAVVAVGLSFSDDADAGEAD